MPSLAEKQMCTGCEACVSVCPKQCITMESALDGFFYPKIVNPEQCVNCNQCVKVCPVINANPLKEQVTKVYAAISIDEEVRKQSSSGGVFSELAKEVIQNQGAVYGAAYDEEFNVRHICIEDIDSLYKLRGAKYAQSEIHDCFKQIKVRMQNQQYVLFSGTPCQVAGLKSFLGKEYETLLCVDFVCHGVPSPVVWKKYVQYRAEIDNAGSLPKEINLRSKESGWSKYSYSTSFKYSDESCFICKNGENTFMKLFVNDYINRESCSQCKFKGYNRTSDITLGDFWGIWDIAPDMDDNKGTSLVLVHSERGMKFWNSIADQLIKKEMLLEQASMQNPSILMSSPAKAKRTDVVEKGISGKFNELEKQLFSNQEERTTFGKRLFRKIRNGVKKYV